MSANSAMAHFFRVKTTCFKEPNYCRQMFVKGYGHETIGTALEGNIGDWDVQINRILADKTETPLDTPLGVLHNYRCQEIEVELCPKENKEGKTKDESTKKNVFQVLMSVQKKYDNLPKPRTENTNKDKVYNLLLKHLESTQVDGVGARIVKGVCDVLWYLDPHRETFQNRCISFSDFDNFCGFNDWKLQKKKKPRVTAEDLEIQMNTLVTILGKPYFLNDSGGHRKLQEMCSNLLEGIRKYFGFLQKQKEKSEENHLKTEPVRSLTDNWGLKSLPVTSSTAPEYSEVLRDLRLLEPYTPLFLYEYEPEDHYEKRKWMENISFPFQVKMYIHSFGNNLDNFKFVWITDENSSEGDLEAVAEIRVNLPVYTTRTMRKLFIKRYAKCGIKPALVRDVYLYLTGSCNAAETSDQAAVDSRVAEYLLSADDETLFYDLRKSNGRPQDTKLDPFWNALDSYLNEVSVVHERRHSDKCYMPTAISL